MDERLKISYETMGSSSYMTVTCPGDMELVHYQMEMVLANEIKNLLPVSRQMIDGETVLYYNITSRIPLSQILEKRKLTRKELCRLIEGAILAVRDSAEFRLPEEGIVMDPGWIYVNPANCVPAFLFLPVSETGESGVRGLITELIMKDHIEMTKDNLIQMLLREVNSRPCSIERLEQCLKDYGGMRSDTPVQKEAASRQEVPRPTVRQTAPDQAVWPAAPQAETKREVGVAAHQEMVREAIPTPLPPLPRQKMTDDRTLSEPVGAEAEAFDREKAKKKFLIPQAVVMVAVAAGISFGMFQDENGGIAVNTILAVLIGIGVLEVILYREIYINSKSKKNSKTSSKEKKDSTGKRRPPVPGTRPVPPKSYHSEPEVPKPLDAQAEPSGEVLIPTPKTSRVPVPQPSFPAPSFSMETLVPEEDTHTGDETELWGDMDEIRMSAYLEYYENGRLSRIPVNPVNGLVVGRLKEQVDFAVKSPRVGKIHARFFCENGQYFVVDINSKNGTYINGNGMRIESNIPYPLQDKDRIMLADSEFTIRCTKG